MALTDSISHAYNGEEFLGEIFYAPQAGGAQNPFDMFRVVGDVKGKKNLYKIAAIQKALREDTGCGFSAVGDAAISDKVLDPKRVKLNLEQCEHTLKDEVFATAMRNGVARNDIRGTVVDEIIKTQMVKTIQEDLVKLLWLGDNDDTDTFYGIADGLLKQFLASGFGGYELDMSANTSIESSVGVLATDGALVALRDIYTNQPAALRAIAPASKKIYATSSIVDNLMATYENTGTDSGLARLSDGGSLAFRGMEVIDISLMDVALADIAATNDATGITNAMVMTTPENIVVGTDIAEPTAFEFWYDQKDEKVYYKAKFNWAVAAIHDELVQFART